MSSIELVVHLWNPPGTRFYTELARWQWESIRKHHGGTRINYVLFFSAKDATAWSHTCEIAGQSFPINVTVQLIEQSREKLFRRAIGRHNRTQQTRQDVLFFTDCDYVFGEGCLPFISQNVHRDSSLCMPANYWFANDHATGDYMLARNCDIESPVPDQKDFHWKRQSIAIGGMQIIGADTAKRIGYLGDTKWCKPVDPEKGFVCFRDDCNWRRVNRLKAKRLEIPNLYRIRHSLSGRDFTGDGISKTDKAAAEKNP